MPTDPPSPFRRVLKERWTIASGLPAGRGQGSLLVVSFLDQKTKARKLDFGRIHQSLGRRTILHFGSGVHGCGVGFDPPTFGLCDLTHLSMRVGLQLHPRGMLATHSLRIPSPSRGLGSMVCSPSSLNRPPFISHMFSIAGSNTGAEREASQGRVPCAVLRSERSAEP